MRQIAARDFVEHDLRREQFVLLALQVPNRR
jgi:hypothetical protein